MRRLAQIVAALLLCLMAGQPLAAALIAGTSPGMACCRKGKGAHACCKRKAMDRPGYGLTTNSRCGSDCCCHVLSFTEKPFELASVSPMSWQMASAPAPAVEQASHFSTSLDRTRWQRPPPTHSTL